MGNRLLASLRPLDRALLEPYLEPVLLTKGQVLFAPGDDVRTTHFPSITTMASLVIGTNDGRAAEAATIGREGAIGGIISSGHKPAFAQAEVVLPGPALAIDIGRLEEAKERSPSIRDLFARYADALLAQVMQSVACNALHPLHARCCRWLLTTQDRSDSPDIALTQEVLAEMLGVQRTTVSTVVGALRDRGLIRYARGQVTILDRPRLEAAACECYGAVRSHFERVLPEIKPQEIIVDPGG
ncbi:Crp/Fnr family transcriptional regulator [Roseomonas sp. CCTCC AB2023176]|uniref:Crp/Fnr family transcriptional regulator n=1 Tax=Roseomonas sp. CCTCC AB2023176 TaxID=3342640 RepID=UPI0035E0F8BE